VPAPRFVVGKACTQDDDCDVGLTCVAADGKGLGVGGPANGLCTLDCSAHGQADCDAVDTGSLCTNGHCFERCQEGPSALGSSKCHNRPDVACAPAPSGAGGYCAPTCRGDFDCGKKKCDPVSGLCVDSVSGTLAIGSPCDPSATKTDCRGTCLYSGSGTKGPETSVCTAVCSIGAPGACGQTPGATSPPTAACLITFDPTEGLGDLGACSELCDCDDDCTNKSFVCQGLDVTPALGRAGACVPPVTAAGATVQHIACGGATDRIDSGVPSRGTDAGSDGAVGPTSPSPRTKASGGCSCRMGAGAPRDDSALAALALTVGVVARRRRRGA